MNLVLIDSSMAGASGDKLLSAFADMMVDRAPLEEDIMKALAAVKGVQNARAHFVKEESFGIRGLKLDISMDYRTSSVEELHRSLDHAAVAAGLDKWGNDAAKRALEMMISVEEETHGVPCLHELADVDTIADLVGVMKAIGLLALSGAEFYSTPVAVGCGWIDCSHGRLPVPAPATLRILERAQIPILSTDTNAELTTPTGAALLAVLTEGKSSPPPFKAAKCGTGIGTRQLAFANITRVMAGRHSGENERICVSETNVDDINGEVLGWLIERPQGRVEDVSVVPMVTKKNRPGYLIRVVVKPDERDFAEDILFNETGTLGVKVFDCVRTKAERIEESIEVSVRGRKYTVMVKTSKKTGLMKPAFQDCKLIAEKEGLSLINVMELVKLQIAEKNFK